MSADLRPSSLSTIFWKMLVLSDACTRGGSREVMQGYEFATLPKISRRGQRTGRGKTGATSSNRDAPDRRPGGGVPPSIQRRRGCGP